MADASLVGGSMLRDLRLLDGYRVPSMWGAMGDGTCGAFLLEGPAGPRHMLRVIASAGLGWDHVSVSLQHRCPTWEEMEWVRARFFRDEATVMQLSVARRDHVSHHPYCLHLWRPHFAEIPLPPTEMVA